MLSWRRRRRRRGEGEVEEEVEEEEEVVVVVVVVQTSVRHGKVLREYKSFSPRVSRLLLA
jgi:hypothetical protein